MDDKNSMFQRRIKQEPFIADKFKEIDSKIASMKILVEEIKQNDNSQNTYVDEKTFNNYKVIVSKQFAELNQVIDSLRIDYKELKEMKSVETSGNSVNLIEEIANIKDLVSKLDMRMFKRGF